MARKIKKLSPSRGRRATLKEKYPDLDKWLDGSPWEMVAGTDFTVTPSTFRTSMQKVGRERGLQVATRLVGDDTVQVQASPREKKSK